MGLLCGRARLEIRGVDAGCDRLDPSVGNELGEHIAVLIGDRNREFYVSTDLRFATAHFAPLELQQRPMEGALLRSAQALPEAVLDVVGKMQDRYREVA
ncbi:MAG TPA: hypothetical protein VK509_15355, partial [Polyangiales bacterium]|nr:hypothetical protein [Polyangiales bacterium]